MGLLLFFGTRVEDRRTCPPDSDGIGGSTNAGLGQFVVDDQLMHGIGLEAVGLGPMRSYEPGLGKGSP